MFRLKGEKNESTEKLLKILCDSGKMYLGLANVKGQCVIRYTINSPSTTLQDINRDWFLIHEAANAIEQHNELKVEEKNGVFG